MGRLAGHFAEFPNNWQINFYDRQALVAVFAGQAIETPQKERPGDLPGRFVFIRL